MEQRRQRVSIIRRRAVGGALATFAVVWAAIFFQLTSGHDPALAKHAQVHTQTQATQTQTTQTQTRTQDPLPTTSTPLNAVTTRQS